MIKKASYNTQAGTLYNPNKILEGKICSRKEYISTVFSITKLTQAIQFKYHIEEILKKEKLLGKPYLQNVLVSQEAHQQRFRATKMFHITGNILHE